MITSRDLKILRMINRYGFLSAENAARLYSVVQSDGSLSNWESEGKANQPISLGVMYRRLQELNRQGLVKHKRVLYGVPGVSFLSAKGVTVSNSPLSAVKSVNLKSFVHRVECAKCSAVLLEKYGGYWETERELYKKVFEASRRRLHEASKVKIPDGVLTLANSNKIAVEIEITQKNNTRLRELVRLYTNQVKTGQYSGVLYYVSREAVRTRLAAIVNELGAMNVIKIQLLPTE